MAGKGGTRKDDTGMLFRMLENKVELERKFGVEVVPRASSEKGPHVTTEVTEVTERNSENLGSTTTTRRSGSEAGIAKAETVKEPTTKSEKSETKAERLAALEKEMAECHECPLGATRTKLVFGVGNPEAELMFVGEAPGADEDAQGIPFVGRAGQLLTKIIEGMGLSRSEVYIANILKCRPPENRPPRPTEVACCIPYLCRQIEIIHPKVMVCLGGVAAKTLLVSDMPVGRMRGTFLEYEGIPLLVTFHPAYLLRNPADKNLVWEDMKMVLHRMGRPIPNKA
jgi:DNA polymerase